jgi:HSP20 family protein
MLAESFAYKVEGDLIHIRGEKHRTSALLDGTYTRMERRYGLFARTLRLPAEVIDNQTKTFYENGVMKIALFKKREPESEADEEAFAGF